MRRTARKAPLVITSFGAVTNLLLAIQVLALWFSFKWEQASEWDSTNDYWRVDGFKLLWAALFAYFSSAAAVSSVGLWGILKSKPTYVRFYRDYSTADFTFCVFFIALATYGSFFTQTRTGVCEQLSRYPEFMRDLSEMGLSPENCERWLERAIFALLAALFLIMAVRLHFLLAVSGYYSSLLRHHHHRASSGSSLFNDSFITRHRIFLLPRHPQHRQSSSQLVYAPVPLSSLPAEVQSQAVEAWVQHPVQGTDPSRHHRHYSHHRKRSNSDHSSTSDSQTGRIRLPIRPGEGLLPNPKLSKA